MRAFRQFSRSGCAFVASASQSQPAFAAAREPIAGLVPVRSLSAFFGVQLGQSRSTRACPFWLRPVELQQHNNNNHNHHHHPHYQASWSRCAACRG